MTSTFLLAMAVPMIILPIERVLMRSAYASDRTLNETLAAALDRHLRGRALVEAPFYRDNAWSFATTTPFNIANGLTKKLAEELGSQGAFDRARKMPASQFIFCLRNALAHGGVLYLDAEGRSSYSSEVAMYGFACGKYLEDRKTLVEVRLLRISENSFRGFLEAWVDWLNESGIARDMAA